MVRHAAGDAGVDAEAALADVSVDADADAADLISIDAAGSSEDVDGVRVHVAADAAVDDVVADVAETSSDDAEAGDGDAEWSSLVKNLRRSQLFCLRTTGDRYTYSPPSLEVVFTFLLFD